MDIKRRYAAINAFVVPYNVSFDGVLESIDTVRDRKSQFGLRGRSDKYVQMSDKYVQIDAYSEGNLCHLVLVRPDVAREILSTYRSNGVFFNQIVIFDNCSDSSSYTDLANEVKDFDSSEI